MLSQLRAGGIDCALSNHRWIGGYTQWQKTYGAEAWARLEQYTGPLI